MARLPLKSGGDDLDDGLELDPELLAPSDAESSASGSDDDLDERNERGASGSEVPEENGDTQPKTMAIDESGEKSRKRRAGSEGGGGEDELKAEKRKRRKAKEKERKAKVSCQPTIFSIFSLGIEAEKEQRQEQIESSLSTNPPTHFTTSEVTQLLLASIRETFPAASPMEVDDLAIPEDRLLPPPDYPPPSSTTDPFAPLAARVETLLQPLQSRKLRPSTPRIIILSLSGLRCADVVRGVRGVKGQGEVAKPGMVLTAYLAFRKAFQARGTGELLEEDEGIDRGWYTGKSRQAARGGYVVLVPYYCLAEQIPPGIEAIKVTKDTVLILDVGHRDSKTRTLLTLPEVRTELWKTVFSGKAREGLVNGGARIGVF